MENSIQRKDHPKDFETTTQGSNTVSNSVESPTVVIGGGLAGVSSAYALASNGVPTLLIDAADELASGASYANAGMLTSSMPEPWNSPGLLWQMIKSGCNKNAPLKIKPSQILKSAVWGMSFFLRSNRKHYRYASKMNFKLARYSIEQTSVLRDNLNLKYDSGSQGSLKVFSDKMAMARSIQSAQYLAKEGLNFSVLSAEEVLQMEPLLIENSQNLVGGVFFPDDESGDARKFTQKLYGEFLNLGGQSLLGEKVEEIFEKNGRITGLLCSGNFISTNRIIVAAGHSSVGLLRKHGIHLPVKPVKGYTVTFECDGQRLPRVSIVDDSKHLAITLLGSRLRISGFAEVVGEDRTVDGSRVAYLLAALDNIFPSVCSTLAKNNARVWTGLRPVSADGLPIIGDCGIQGLFVNTGHGHLGWTMAVGSGQLLVDHILDRKTEIDLKPYRADRHF